MAPTLIANEVFTFSLSSPQRSFTILVFSPFTNTAAANNNPTTKTIPEIITLN